MYIYIKFWIGANFSKLVNSAPIKKSDVFSYIKTKKWIFEWQKAPKQSENTHNRLEKILLHKKLIAFIKMHTNLQIVRIRQKTQNWGWERRKGSCLMEIFFFFLTVFAPGEKFLCCISVNAPEKHLSRSPDTTLR